jgi:hypothetical protein
MTLKDFIFKFFNIFFLKTRKAIHTEGLGRIYGTHLRNGERTPWHGAPLSQVAVTHHAMVRHC